MTAGSDPGAARVADGDADVFGDPAVARKRRQRGACWRAVSPAVLLVAAVAVSLNVGRYPVGFGSVLGMVFGRLPFIDTNFTPADETVLVHIRLPRVGCGLLVGAGLAAAGAGYQTMFRNPLVSPHILGVSAGAGFGAALGLLIHSPYWQVEAMAFAGGLLAAALSLGIGRSIGGDSPILLVLAGVVVGSVFSALIAVTEFLANPEDTLPAITFWLMGGLARPQLGALLVPAVIITVSSAVLYAVRWPVTVLATSGEDARTLGVNTRRIWTTVVITCTLITATAVSLAGIIGWVGLLVPHLTRAVVGPAFGRLLVASAVLGGAFVVGVDDLARSVSSVDIPLGILTALVGAPFFIVVLAKMRRQW